MQGITWYGISLIHYYVVRLGLRKIKGKNVIGTGRKKKNNNFVKHKQAIKKRNGLVLFIKAFTCSNIY